ncbi:hypothetical protein CPB97_004979, partial [Podila verticillata]
MVEEELAEEDAGLEAELEAQYQADKEAKRKAKEEEEERELAKLESYIRRKRLANEIEKRNAQRASEKDIEVQAKEEDEWAGFESGENEDEELGGDDEEGGDEGQESEYEANEAGEEDKGTEVDYTTCKLPAAYHIVLNLQIGNKEKGFCHSRRDLDPRTFDIIRGIDSYELILVQIKDIVKELPRFCLLVDSRPYLQPNPSTPQKDHWELVEENFFPSLERVWCKEAKRLGKDGNPVGAAAKLDFYVY